MKSSPGLRVPRAWMPFFALLLVISLGFYLGRDAGDPSAPRKSHAIQSRAFRDGLAGFESASTAAPTNGSHLARRDDYTCGPGRPCANGACCGGTGVCGYGPTYCGAGCVSNCNAHAECGQYALEPGKTCPLKTCCSEFGFCGTTHDFCTGKCQSNCIMNPKPPGGSPPNQALSRVIGYYESWSYRSQCNNKKPSDMPLSELTHLNYAFAFISPGSFELVTMDANTPESLFRTTTDTKQYNPNLKVYISVGGWTFSDNGTVTQPLFSEIASSEANRQKFADNCVNFMNRYGFDGIDIDWEYPGAPDRGGKPEDTDNFTLLLKTLRQTFNASPRQLGISFTIPSSLWYLRWFDLPGLLKYADWTNLMSYDLHGTWDRNNPIGAIAQAHTNLTEIKLAAELLWRVGVQPSKVSLGFGFYGRSFELANPSCSKPGCPFTGGARAGPCSDTAGILMYYEIQAILKQVSGLKPIYDEDAAVKYIVFDKNQWVSYDDGETFDAKLAWANAIGFGGSLIWAVDTDDDKYTAMSGFMGKEVAHVNLQQKQFEVTEATIAQSLVGENGQDCKVLKDYSCKAARDLRCESGFTLVGWDRDGCKKGDEGKPICCPQATAPNKCMWRGSGGDCNGQCHAGEATIAKSSWGGKGAGFDGESGTNQCSRGVKAFCCEAGDWKDVISGCEWSSCGGSCPSNKKEVIEAARDCMLIKAQKYCCPNDTPLHDCQWRGNWPDCPNAKCEIDEVAVVNDPNGEPGWFACHWGRQRTGCCKVSKPPPKPLECTVTICDIDPSACALAGDDWGNKKRDEGGLHELERRGPPRQFKWITTAGAIITQWSLTYPTPPNYMRNLRNNLRGLARQWYQMRSRSCSDPSVRPTDFGNLDTPPTGGQVEHIVPLAFVLGRYPAIANHGRHFRSVPVTARNPVPDGDRTRTPAIPDDFWQNVWRSANALPSDFEIRQPDEYVNEQIGSMTNPTPFVILRDAVNAAKGRLEIFNRPMAQDRFEDFVDAAAAGDEESVESFMAPLRETVAVFEYLRDDTVVTEQDAGVARVQLALQRIERAIPAAQGLSAHWNEAYPHYFQQVSEFARTFMSDSIRYARNAFSAEDAPFRESVMKELKDLENKIPDLKYAFED